MSTITRRTPASGRATRAIAIIALLGAGASLSACNTIAGAGEDVGAVGAGVAHGADAVKNGS